MYNYFLKNQLKNTNFDYAIQFNKSRCVDQFFWVDAKRYVLYQYFRDVITFDTTYLKNHHRVIFGCDLLVNETTKFYALLLKTWLKAMLGPVPSRIILYDDKVMGKAIAKILPKLCS